MMPSSAGKRLGLILLATMTMTACQTVYVRTAERTVTPLNSSSQKVNAPEVIDLTKIGHLAPKGRVQDKEFNQIELVDQLIDRGKESIPLLIGKLDDETRVAGPVVDYRSETTAGDVALIILSDFSIDSAGKETIPEASWDNFLQKRANENISAGELLDRALAKNGRRGMKAKWQKIWTTWERQIFWDDNERCFYVSPIKY